MKTAVVLSVAVLANSLGAVCLSKGMKEFPAAGASEGNWLWAMVLHAGTNPWVAVGVLLLLIFLASYLTALSWADLSFVLPATAPGYVLTAGFSRIFLDEAISPARWAGTFLIVVGTWLVARTYSSRSRPKSRGRASREAPGA